jgi:hypothetical protein
MGWGFGYFKVAVFFSHTYTLWKAHLNFPKSQNNCFIWWRQREGNHELFKLGSTWLEVLLLHKGEIKVSFSRFANLLQNLFCGLCKCCPLLSAPSRANINTGTSCIKVILSPNVRDRMMWLCDVSLTSCLHFWLTCGEPIQSRCIRRRPLAGHVL